MCTGIEPLLFGSAATATTAATTGLIGAGGAFALGPALMTGFSAVSALGSIAQGQQQKAYANYQASQAEADAKAERDAAMIHADKIRKAARLQAGEARAALAGSGVDVGEGTAVDINSSIYANAEEDAWTAILGGKNKSDQLNAQAQGLRISGDNAETASYWNAAGSALGGAAKVWQIRAKG